MGTHFVIICRQVQVVCFILSKISSLTCAGSLHQQFYATPFFLRLSVSTILLLFLYPYISLFILYNQLVTCFISVDYLRGQPNYRSVQTYRELVQELSQVQDVRLLPFEQQGTCCVTCYTYMYIQLNRRYSLNRVFQIQFNPSSEFSGFTKSSSISEPQAHAQLEHNKRINIRPVLYGLVMIYRKNKINVNTLLQSILFNILPIQ
eukprot:TRINITY_DN2670_c0_g1_i8.p2 TRINITY_DN2670_c0_g1~~TRINITY_DN2670_c0_g1_i8.p2  ORF type:complete len:205 (-),score=-10.07 TRINITY_DN2670_c0_g1_i8:618-1232(-)